MKADDRCRLSDYQACQSYLERCHCCQGRFQNWLEDSRAGSADSLERNCSSTMDDCCRFYRFYHCAGCCACCPEYSARWPGYSARCPRGDWPERFAAGPGGAAEGSLFLGAAGGRSRPPLRAPWKQPAGRHPLLELLAAASLKKTCLAGGEPSPPTGRLL